MTELRFYNALDLWRKERWDACSPVHELDDHWVGDTCALLETARSQQGELTAEQSNALDQTLEDLTAQDHCSSISEPLLEAILLPENHDVAKRARLSEQLICLTKGICHGVRAASLLHNWQPNSPLPPGDFVKHLGSCFRAYHGAWDLWSRPVVEKVALAGRQACRDRATLALDACLPDLLCQQEQDSIAWLNESTWLLVRRLLSFVLGDEDPTAELENTVQLLLVARDPESKYRGLVRPGRVSAIAEGQSTLYLDPVALGVTLLDDEMLDSLRLTARISRNPLEDWHSQASVTAQKISLRLTLELEQIRLLEGGSAGGILTAASFSTAKRKKLNERASASFVVRCRREVREKMRVDPFYLPSVADVELGPVSPLTILDKVSGPDFRALSLLRVFLHQKQTQKNIGTGEVERVCQIWTREYNRAAQRQTPAERRGECTQIQTISTIDEAIEELVRGSASAWAQQERSLFYKAMATARQYAFVATVSIVTLLLFLHEHVLRFHISWLNFWIRNWSDTTGVLLLNFSYGLIAFGIYAYWNRCDFYIPILRSLKARDYIALGVAILSFIYIPNFVTEWRLKSRDLSRERIIVLDLKPKGTKVMSLGAEIKKRVYTAVSTYSDPNREDGRTTFPPVFSTRAIDQDDDESAELLALYYLTNIVIWGEYDDTVVTLRLRDIASDHENQKQPLIYKSYLGSLDLPIIGAAPRHPDQTIKDYLREASLIAPHRLAPHAVEVLLHVALANRCSPPEEARRLEQALEIADRVDLPIAREFDSLIRTRLAACSINIGDWEKAYRYSTEVIELAQQRPDLVSKSVSKDEIIANDYLNRASTCICFHELDLARADVDVAESLGLHPARILFMRARIAETARQRNEAIALYQEWIDTYGGLHSVTDLPPGLSKDGYRVDLAFAYNNLSNVYGSQFGVAERTRVLGLLNKAIEVEPRIAMFWWNRAILRIQLASEMLGEVSEPERARLLQQAIDDCAQSLHLDRFAMQPRLLLVYARLLAGQHRSALMECEEIASNIQADNLDLQVLHGLALHFTGQLEAADEFLSQAVLLVPQADVRWHSVSPISVRVPLLKLIAKAAPHSSLEPLLAGYAYRLHGDWQRARQYFFEATIRETDPDNQVHIDKLLNTPPLGLAE